jgi:hypothetical protein
MDIDIFAELEQVDVLIMATRGDFEQCGNCKNETMKIT